MNKGISQSRFNMWRAVVAMIHADSIVKPHEINFILESTKDLPLSGEQRRLINLDMAVSADIAEIFAGITNPRDKQDFFHLARAVCWSDGDFDAREQSMLHRMSFLLTAKSDRSMMSASLRSFQEIYIEGREPDAANGEDMAVLTIIRGLMGRARAT